eukprot:766690-Hanusia_phi.AAC.1
MGDEGQLCEGSIMLRIGRAALAAGAGAAVLLLVLVANAGQDQTELSSSTTSSPSSPSSAHPWAFKPTKFGPLRRKEWQSSRYQVLTLWHIAERSTETCMNAEDMLYPQLEDNNCQDVDRAMKLMQKCMRNQRDGMQNLADSKNGMWDALPKLVYMTHALGEQDRAMVEKKLGSSVVFYTLARLEALHAKCHDAVRSTRERNLDAQLLNYHDKMDSVLRMENMIRYMRRSGAVLPEVYPKGVEGEWGANAVARYRIAPRERFVFSGRNDPLRRAARRGYVPQFPQGA